MLGKEWRNLSTAFRNFLIVFIIFLVAFGLVAWKVVVPYINTELLGEVDRGDDTDESEVTEESEVSNDIIESGRNRDVSIAFVGMANEDHLANIFFIRIDESKGIYLTTSIPYDTKVDNNGRSAPLYSYMYMRSNEDIVATIPYLVGYEIDYYAVFDYDGLYSIIKELGTVSVSFDTEVKVYNPDFMDEIQECLDNDEIVPDAYYNTFGPGSANVSASDLEALWEYEPNDNDTDFSVKCSIYESAFYALTKKSALGANSEKYLDIMNGALATTLGTEAFEEYGDIMFANGYLFKGNYSKKMLYNQTFTKMISKIREAMGDY